MKQIELTKGKVVLVDDEDYEWLIKKKWYAIKGHSTFYAARKIKPKGIQKTIYMHREIMHTPSGMQVDHIDHNGLNCQRKNMRNCTHTQNQMNMKGHGVLSKYVGVSYNKGRYKSYISIDKKIKHLGMFDDEISAAKAFDLAAIKYRGEFANLNFK